MHLFFFGYAILNIVWSNYGLAATFFLCGVIYWPSKNEKGG
jgi:hypothetical protein